MKKLRLFINWCRKISEIKSTLNQRFNIRIDNAFRIYTVINVPENLIGEEYSLKKADIDRISNNYLAQYTKDLGKVLDENSLKELYAVYEIKKVDKYSYLIVVGFSLFKSHKFFNRLYFFWTPVILVSLILSFLLI